MKIKNIDQSQFQQIDNIRRIIVHNLPRRFATINLDNLGQFGINWRSDLIEPIVMFSPDKSMVWMGVDQQLVAIDLQVEKIAVTLSLSSSLVQILALSSLTVILTELEVFVFNLDNSIRCIKGLPNIGSEISIYGQDLIITLLDGEVLILNIETGNFQELKVSIHN